MINQFRPSRIWHDNNGWWLNTREGVMGPYQSERYTKQVLGCYIELMNASDDSVALETEYRGVVAA